MVPGIFRSRNTLIENIKSLETQLADLQTRLNIIADWINSRCYGFLDVPETVIIAMGRCARSSSVSVEAPTSKTEIFRAKSSPDLGTQKKKPKFVRAKHSNGDSKDSKVTNTGQTEHNQKDPLVKLSNLSLQDIKIFTDKHDTTNLQNLHCIKPDFSKINCNENSNSLFCSICNEHFTLRIQLERHKLNCHSKNVAITHNESSEKNPREINQTATNEESVYGNVLSFTPTSDEESDSGSEYDPLGDVSSNDSCSEDILENATKKGFANDSSNLDVESDIKDEVDIKEETVEDDVFIPQDSNSDILMQKQSVESSCNKNNKIILSLPEYHKVVESMGRRSLTCAICNKTFTTARIVYSHEIKVHLTKEDRKTYLNWRNSERIKEMKNYTFICEICGRPCKDSTLLYKHKTSHVSSEVKIEVIGDGRPNYRCLNCNFLFSERQKCLLHVVRNCANETNKRNEKGERKEKGKRKEKKNKQEKQLSQKERTNNLHHKSNDGQKVIQCETCGLIVNSNAKLKMHIIRKHSGEKQFICKQCGRGFVLKQTLSHHELAIHSNERPHKCQYCEKTFVLKFVKDKHEKLHLGVLTVSCHICGFTFATKQGLKSHIAGIHEKQRPYKCDMCDKSFKTSTARNYHIKTHNNPNGRKRALNKETDDLKAAAKRRHFSNRIPLLNASTDSIESPAK